MGLFQFIEDELLLINPESSANREYKKLKRVRKGSVVLRLGSTGQSVQYAKRL